MTRFVIVKLNADVYSNPAFWSGKSSEWVEKISLATRYKKRDEADRIAFRMAVKNGAMQEIAVDPASKYEGQMRWEVWYPGEKCPDCGGGKGVRDMYMCNETCHGYRPQKHRHATCGGCGFMAFLIPIVSILR